MPDLLASLPSALRSNARWERLGSSRIPAMLVHPNWSSGGSTPVVLWMHGRTVNKELDPGRYLRWMRAGIGVCAVDLPGHGERFDSALQEPHRSFEVVTQMIAEIDELIDAVRTIETFDDTRVGIGGVSAGGMAALGRLCRDHPFTCASVEATTGSWAHQRERQMFRDVSREAMQRHNPINNLDRWREIPFQALHAKLDEWVPIDGQQEFIESLQQRYTDPSLIDFISFDQTGAPNEHIGFGKFASEAKDLQRDFFRKWLVDPASA